MVCLGVAACTPVDQSVTPAPAAPFTSDVAFLRQHTELVLLDDPSSEAQVAVAPAYQGRVMTSTTGGRDAPSFGWIGRQAIASRERQPHMNVYELETSSPALDLSPGQRYTHVHRTFHLVGPEGDLDRIARAVFKIGLAELTNAFGPRPADAK